MSKRNKKIVCLGGGTGVSVALSGFKKYPLDLTAIVTMFDSGGSSGKLRKELGILPLGDIRQCLISTASDVTYAGYFNCRDEGDNMGNFLIAEEEMKTGSLEIAIDRWRKKLKSKAKVFPVTFTDANIRAILRNGEEIEGEEAIINCPYLSKLGIKKIFLEPGTEANPKAISAIKKADLIIITPGKFYTSIIPIFLVKGISAAIRKSRAKKVFVCNLMTQIGNTDGFSVVDFLTILEKYLGKDIIDYVIFNTGKLSANQIKEVRKIFPKADFIKYDKSLLKRTPTLPPPSRKRAPKFIGVDVIDRQIRKLNPADILVKRANKRTIILHEPNKLAKVIINLCRR